MAHEPKWKGMDFQLETQFSSLHFLNSMAHGSDLCPPGTVSYAVGSALWPRSAEDSRAMGEWLSAQSFPLICYEELAVCFICLFNLSQNGILLVLYTCLFLFSFSCSHPGLVSGDGD